MIRTNGTTQRMAVKPFAALVGPFMADPQLGAGWAASTNPQERETSRRHGVTAIRSTRYLGRSST